MTDENPAEANEHDDAAQTPDGAETSTATPVDDAAEEDQETEQLVVIRLADEDYGVVITHVR